MTKHIKSLWKNTEAMSPIIAVILVIGIAVAAGVGLYYWFNDFQASAQGQVENSTSGQIQMMSFENSKIYLKSYHDNIDVKGVDASGDTKSENSNGDGWIYWAMDHGWGPGYGPNGKNGVGWQDERFIVEIPIIITSSSKLDDIKLIAEKPNAIKGSLNYYRWLHLDRNNEYQLLKKDDTSFIGFIGNDTTQVIVDETNGYTYYFGGTKHFGLDIKNGTINKTTGTLADSWSTWWDDANLNYPDIPNTNGSLSVIRLFASDGTTYNAFAKDNSGNEFGWITCNYSSDNNEYFRGDKVDSMFANNTYYVADTLKPNEAITIYTYFMVNSLGLDDGTAEITLPYTVITEEGLIGSKSITLVINE